MRVLDLVAFVEGEFAIRLRPMDLAHGYGLEALAGGAGTLELFGREAAGPVGMVAGAGAAGGRPARQATTRSGDGRQYRPG